VVFVFHENHGPNCAGLRWRKSSQKWKRYFSWNVNSRGFVKCVLAKVLSSLEWLVLRLSARRRRLRFSPNAFRRDSSTVGCGGSCPGPRPGSRNPSFPLTALHVRHGRLRLSPVLRCRAGRDRGTRKALRGSPRCETSPAGGPDGTWGQGGGSPPASARRAAMG
jgi:hypothetical protein